MEQTIKTQTFLSENPKVREHLENTSTLGRKLQWVKKQGAMVGSSITGSDSVQWRAVVNMIMKHQMSQDLSSS